MVSTVNCFRCDFGLGDTEGLCRVEGVAGAVGWCCRATCSPGMYFKLLTYHLARGQCLSDPHTGYGGSMDPLPAAVSALLL